MTANREVIEKLLFERRDIETIEIARVSGIPYVTIAKYRNGERNYLGMSLKTAITLTKTYGELNKIRGEGIDDTNDTNDYASI